MRKWFFRLWEILWLGQTQMTISIGERPYNGNLLVCHWSYWPLQVLTWCWLLLAWNNCHTGRTLQEARWASQGWAPWGRATQRWAIQKWALHMSTIHYQAHIPIFHWCQPLRGVTWWFLFFEVCPALLAQIDLVWARLSCLSWAFLSWTSLSCLSQALPGKLDALQRGSGSPSSNRLLHHSPALRYLEKDCFHKDDKNLGGG